MKTLTNSRISRVALIVMVFICGSAIAVAAKGPSRGGGDQEQRQVAVSPVDKVTIAKKTLEAVITNIGDTYVLSKQTIIIDTNGMQLSVRKMPVPCEALVTYAQIRAGKQAIRIAIQRVSEDATRHWTAKQPE